MVASPPKNYNVSEIQKFLFQPALTSNYEVHIPIPEAVAKFNSYVKINKNTITELLKVSCSEASLPGSSLATHELNNDVTGITQRHAYRRLFDDRADFTFYVTVDQKSSYDQIRVFERWLQFISGEQETGSNVIEEPFRVAWPEDYKAASMHITKFERTATSKTGFKKEKSVNGQSGFGQKKLEYTFFNAYPISVSSMPVSYDSSSLLKCTVSFTYDKYIMKNTSASSGKSFPESSASSATGVPDVSNTSNYWNTDAWKGGTDFSAATNLDFGLNLSGENALNLNTTPNQLNRQVNIGAGTQAENNQITIQRANEQQIA